MLSSLPSLEVTFETMNLMDSWIGEQPIKRTQTIHTYIHYLSDI